MANPTLLGTEVLQVQAVNSGTGLAATTQTCTTQQIANLAGSTGISQIVLDGATSGTTTVLPQAIASGTLSLPAATDTLTGKATTDVFTNKTLDTAGSGNVFKINGTQVSAVTGTGSAVLATSPALVTPTLGVATATSLNGLTVTTSTGTLTVPNGVVLTGPASSGTAMTLGNAETITGAKTFTNSDLLILGSSTGSNTFTALNASATNYTTSVPAVTGVMASTSGANLFVTDVYRSSASVTANGTVTPATITGLAGSVAVGTYRFRAVLPSTVASGTGGIAYNFLLTTAVLSSIQYGATMTTASAVQYTQGTTATSGTVIATQAAVVLNTVIEGTFVVSTAGTFTLQMAQNTSNASNSVTLIGSSMELCRIA